MQVAPVGVFDKLAAFADKVGYLIKTRLRHLCAPFRIAGDCIISAFRRQSRVIYFALHNLR
jgi:hypothetical protein